MYISLFLVGTIPVICLATTIQLSYNLRRKRQLSYAVAFINNSICTGTKEDIDKCIKYLKYKESR